MISISPIYTSLKDIVKVRFVKVWSHPKKAPKLLMVKFVCVDKLTALHRQTGEFVCVDKLNKPSI